jgi:hypothetical protein
MQGQQQILDNDTSIIIGSDPADDTSMNVTSN